MSAFEITMGTKCGMSAADRETLASMLDDLASNIRQQKEEPQNAAFKLEEFRDTLGRGVVVGRAVDLRIMFGRRGI